MVNDPKIIEEIIQKIKGLSKEQIENAMEEVDKFFNNKGGN